MVTNEDVRCGQCVAEHNKEGAIRYKAVFEGKNCYFYRFVSEGRGYRGALYESDGWVLAWTDIQEHVPMMPPSFVPIRDHADEQE